MRDERPVNGHEAQILDQALSKKKPIERIACRGFRFHIRQNVVMSDCDELKSHSLHKLWEQHGRYAESELSQPRLDSDLPQTCDARMHHRLGVGDGVPHWSCKRVRPLVEKSYQDIRIEQKPHGSRVSSQQKILGQGGIEIVCNASDDCANSVLSLERRDGLDFEPTLLPMRDQIENRLAIAGDDDRLALFDTTRQRSQVVFCLLDRYRRHDADVATDGHLDKTGARIFEDLGRFAVRRSNEVG
jgi:hypothetical protein